MWNKTDSVWYNLGRVERKGVFEHAQNAQVNIRIGGLIWAFAVRICSKTLFRMVRSVE